LAEEVRFEVGEDSPDSEQALKMIIANASRATEIVSDLMLFARQSDAKPKYQDINETIISSMRLTEYLARKSKVEVKTKLESPPPVTIYDSQQIGQVLINLIQNAIQAMPDGGELSLTSSQNRKWVDITIEDTGVGIPRKNLSKIFDPFFSTKPEGEGTGLGLSVSYGIITQHKGKIEVKSKVNKGTTFTIKIPRKKPKTD
jgi:signal transduction histidine kinase